MTLDESRYNNFLDEVAAEMYISENDHLHAIYNYVHVSRWLSDSNRFGNPNVYLHGSFRLGTVARPTFNGIEVNYCIDMVCEFPECPKGTRPENIKYVVGERLQAHSEYSTLVSYEGSKCWNIIFGTESGRNFQLKILPSISKPTIKSETSVIITKRSEHHYEWLASDPEGYASWFDSRNGYPNSRVISTPLQRAIQIMKRHRDMIYCIQPPMKYPPASIVITTLAAQLYSHELTTFSALSNIVNKIDGYRNLLEYDFVSSGPLTADFISRMSDGTWYVGNPMNPQENFASCWHHNNDEGARSFFAWIRSIKEDLIDFRSSLPTAHFRKHFSICLGISDRSPHFKLIERYY